MSKELATTTVDRLDETVSNTKSNRVMMDSSDRDGRILY